MGALPQTSETEAQEDAQLAYDIDGASAETEETDNATEEAERHFSDED